MEDFHEEAGIHEVKDGVFDAADILVDVHPVVPLLRIPGLLLIAGVGVTQEVPRRADKGIHRVRFPFRRAAAFRAGTIDKVAARRQRRYGTGREFDVFRQLDRQLVFGDELFAAGRAVNDWNGSAPIALTGNEPVAEFIVDGLLAKTFIGQPLRNSLAAFFVGQAVEFAGIDQSARFVVGPFHGRKVEILFFILNDEAQGQVKFFGKFPVALVMSRYAHDGTGPVVG